MYRVFLLFSVLFLSCVVAQEESDKSAWDYLITTAAADYSLFDASVRAVGYPGVLANDGAGGRGITVFAPNDAAFVSTANELGYSGTDKNESFAAIQKVLMALNGNKTFVTPLYQIIGYHVVAGGYSPEMLESSSGSLLTYSGNLISVANSSVKHTAEGVLTNPSYNGSPIYVSNGIIYPINRILFPFLVDTGQTKDIISSAPLTAPVAAAGTTENNPNSTDDTATAAQSNTDGNNFNTGGGGRSVCFPADEKVRLRDGTTIPIEDLRAGDHVIVNQAGESSPVFAFTHKIRYGTYEFVRIHAQGDVEITLSAKHYIYANGQAAPAEAVAVGDVLRIPRDAAHAALAPIRSLVLLGVKEPLGALFYSGLHFQVREIQRLAFHLSYLRFLAHFPSLISS